MILLLGGTSEAVPIAAALSQAGFKILLSTATRMAPRGKLPPEIRRRTGHLDVEGLSELIRREEIRAVVDATHPYAEAVSANARAACCRNAVPYLAFERPSTLADTPDIHWAADHDRAATLACSFGQPVLLTIGIRNLSPYVAAARGQGLPLIARVLDHPSSRETCRRLGLTADEICCANGPFSVAEISP